MEPLRCHRVDLARAGLPPGAPLDPVSAAHVRRCVRCQDAIRLDAMASEALARVRPTLSMAARARIAEAAALEARRQRRRAGPVTPGRMTLALAASVVLSIALGGLLAQARDAIEPPVPPETADAAPAAPLLEALLAHHQNGDVPLPAGVRFATRLPESLAVEAVPAELLPEQSVTAAHAPGDEEVDDYDDPALFCECGVAERSTTATSFFVLDREAVDVDSDLEAEMAAEGSAVVHFGTSRVTVTSRDQELFVTIATTRPTAVVAARYL